MFYQFICKIILLCLYRLVAIAIFIIFFFSFADISAQTNAKADSLKEVFKHAKTDTERVDILARLSNAYKCRDTVEKLSAAKEAVLIAQNMHWKKGEINTNYIIGFIYTNCHNDFSFALDFFRRGFNIAKSIHDTSGQISGLTYMSQAYGILNQHVKKIDCYRELLTLKISPERKIGALSNMGSTFAIMGNYTTALNYYDSALRSFGELPKTGTRKWRDDTLAIAWLKVSVGDIYLSMSEYDHASGNYKTALALFENSKSKPGIIMALTCLGKANYSMKDDDKAVSYYTLALNKCIDDADSNAYKNDRLTIHNLLGKLYIRKGMTAKALDHELTAMSLIREDPNSKQIPVTYSLLGEIYTAQEKYDKAIYYLKEAITLCKQSGALDNEKDALLTLSNTYAQMNQPARSLEAYKNYIAIRDSVYSLDKAKEITRHEMNADFTEKQLKLTAEQDKKNAIQKAVMDQTLKRQRLAYVTFTLIIILMVAVAILLFNRFKLREKLEMQMAITGERTRISSEMHDDIGSELSKISLLSEIVKGDAAGQNTQSHLDNISRSSRDLLDKMGEIVWSLNNKYDTLESLIIYIRRYAKEYFSATDIDCKITMSEHFPDVAIEGDVRRDIFLVVKEALHNVLKHSGGSLVAITITTDSHFININIHDNGVGIDLSDIAIFGNGLGNMKNRIEKVNGKFAIKNQNGTDIDFNIPIPN